MPMQPAPALPPPSRLLWAAELPRAAWTLAELAASKPGELPRGDGRPLLLLPGLINSDRSMLIMARYLRRLGYRVETWGLGRNFGTRTVGSEGERLLARVRDYAERAGAPVTLIGVSLGGIMARLAAHRLGAAIVREVITIASPYAAGPRATNVWRTYQLVSGERIDDPALLARVAEIAAPLPMPATAIWSSSDGLVNGRACYVDGEPGLRVIEIKGGHIGVHYRAKVLRTVAEVLGG
ncbi:MULTISPECIES: GPI inositol-deacylase [Sphingomonas]|uniref:GPI inositol-deacylase n=1 Tax=Sphingomonas TaxID=13687 RepID=UPI000AAD2A29|nr:GPI inositol-deacylase [Sphingomonas sp. CCH10-B3]